MIVINFIVIVINNNNNISWTSFIRLHTQRLPPSTRFSRTRRKSSAKLYAKRTFSTTTYKPTRKLSLRTLSKRINSISTIKSKSNPISYSPRMKASGKTNSSKSLHSLRWMEDFLSKKTIIGKQFSKILRRERNRIKQKADFMSHQTKLTIMEKFGFDPIVSNRQERVFYRPKAVSEVNFNGHRHRRGAVKWWQISV